jgi:hypothetical protein
VVSRFLRVAIVDDRGGQRALEERHVAMKHGNDHAVDALRYLVNGLERRGAGTRRY